MVCRQEEVKFQGKYTTQDMLGAGLLTLSGFGGFCVFHLQSLSLSGLIERSGLGILPPLLLLQALVSWSVLKLLGPAILKTAPRLLFLSLLGGLVAVLWAHSSSLSKFEAAALYLGAQLVIASLRMSLHVLVSTHTSVLRHPQISTRTALFEESGFLVGALVGVASASSLLQGYMSGLGFLGAIALGVFVRSLLPKGEVSSETLPKSTADNVYLPSLIQLFYGVAALKALQWFGLAWGLDALAQTGSKPGLVFSQLAAVQGTCTTLILFTSLKFSTRLPTWGVGFKVLLGAQMIMAALIALFPYPWALMGAESIRKVLEHGFLGRSLQLLTSSLPAQDRLQVRHLMERWGVTAGLATIGVLSTLVLYGWLPLGFLFLIGMALGLFALKKRHALQEVLIDFQLARLSGKRVADVLEACQALGNPESAHHIGALGAILERNPRASLAKNLLLAMGRMKNPKAPPKIRPFLLSEREDIQIAALNALMNYPGHETNLTFLKLLRDLSRSESLLRINVMRVLTRHLGTLAVPYLLEILERPNDERAAANAIEILGEIAEHSDDESLELYLGRFLDAKFCLRIRANAAVACARNKKLENQVQEILDALMTSPQLNERAAFAYAAGTLGWKGHRPWIESESVASGMCNPTLLVALLKLGSVLAAEPLARILASDDETSAQDVILRLSAVQRSGRLEVYQAMLTMGPRAIERLLGRLRNSGRDYDEDRNLVRLEVQRLGWTIDEDAAVVEIPRAA